MNEEKKLHIDEDWKSQVDREKERFRSPRQTDPASVSENSQAAEDIASADTASSEVEVAPTASPDVQPQASAGPSSDVELGSARRNRRSSKSGGEDELPPASLMILVSSLASQAMASMGQLPGEDGKSMPVNLAFARHFIDLLGVIEDKTRNNLSREEVSFLNNTLHHLRMLFVELS